MKIAVATLKSDASGLPWALFLCRACGLIYDESKGDEDSGLAPGTRFADIPEDWACPLCGVTKADFEPYTPEDIVRQTRSSSGAGSATGTRLDPGTVIIGAGRAGWQMAESLRARDAAMPITLVTACNGDVYDKPMLSVAMARGIQADSLPKETGAQAAARLGVKLLAHTQAVRVTPASRRLRTTRGTLRYRNLVLAHGARSRSLPQLPDALCWRINHLQTYAKFRAALGHAPQRVAVVGAGLIGCELANDLALARHHVTLMDVAPRPLAAALSEAQSQQLLDAWAALPLQFIGGVQVQGVTVAGTGKQITSGCGQHVVVDHIVVAAGLQTAGQLAASAGLAFNNGIAVDAQTLATSVHGIHALGDCISIDGEVSRYIEPIGRQARLLADRITGAVPTPYSRSRVPLRIKTSSLPLTV